jgi:anti-sigma B factor antagonist
MNLSAEARDEAVIVHVEEERLDAAIAIRFKDQIRELTQEPSARVILDMSKVAFLDSSGLGAVVAVMKALAPERRLELSGLTPNVEKVFRLTRMDSVFRIHPSLDQAFVGDIRHAG